MTESEIVEFKCVYGTASFSGFAYVDELDDDEPLHFYDKEFGVQEHLQNADWVGVEEDQQKLYESFVSDTLFVQFLADFKDENKTIDRGDYTLLINKD